MIFSVSLVSIFQLDKLIDIEKHSVYILCNSIGLSAFSVLGGLVAIKNGLCLTTILFFSFLTSNGGSIIRDILINEVPSIFKTGFSASTALIIGMSLFILEKLSTLNHINIIMLFCFGIMLRLIGYKKEWSLPCFQ